MSRPVLIPSEVAVATPAAALLASVAAAWRMAGEQVGFFESWFAAAGLLCPLLAVLIAATRAARRTVRTLAPGGATALLVGAALWALVSLPVTAVLGTLLKANTHHRALAGATFAVLALVVHVGAALFAWRITALVLPHVRRPAARTFVAMVLGAGALVLFAVTLTSAAMAQDPSAASTSAAAIPALLVDGALVLVATGVAAMVEIPLKRRTDISWLGAGVLVFVTAVGLVLVMRSAALARAAVGRAPIVGAVAEAVGLSPDR